MELIYLDNNATTKPAAQVVDAMTEMLRDWYGNPSSVHRFGQRARHAVDQARAQVSALLGCAETELTFTGGGTEAVNTALRGLLASRPGKKRIITTAVEHSATLQLCQQLARDGFEVVEVGVDRQGRLDLESWQSALNDQTAFATAMWANNETGVIFPIAKLAEMCRAKSVPFHCDGTQAVGKIPVDVKAAGVDCMSLAAHKFHGPKGVGALFARRGLRLGPLIIGGPQERGHRGGTENVPGVVGMGVAGELAAKAMADMPRIAALRDCLEDGVLQSISDTFVNGDRANRIPNTTNISFARLEAEAILLLLSEKGICASAGAACSSGSLEPSHVIKAMRCPPNIAHGAIRFSLSKFTTDEEITGTLEILPAVIERLRRVLPVGT